MVPPHAEAMPTPSAQPDLPGDDWFAQRMGFQLELARRMMRATELTESTLREWTATHAVQFAAIVDAHDADGEAIRQLIREDRDAALERVHQRLLH